MVACLLPAADLASDSGCDEARRQRRAEEQVVDAQSRISGIGVSEIIPECVDALWGMHLAHRVGPP